MIIALTGNLDIPDGNVSFSPPTKGRSCYGKEFNPYLNLPQQQSLKKLDIDRFLL